LEKQWNELQKQLKINYSNLPSKEQGRMAKTVVTEQITAIKEEIEYVRQRYTLITKPYQFYTNSS
jgi:hypothetical protein